VVSLSVINSIASVPQKSSSYRFTQSSAQSPPFLHLTCLCRTSWMNLKPLFHLNFGLTDSASKAHSILRLPGPLSSRSGFPRPRNPGYGFINGNWNQRLCTSLLDLQDKIVSLRHPLRWCGKKTMSRFGLVVISVGAPPPSPHHFRCL